jgi:hypothetical protein
MQKELIMVAVSNIATHSPIYLVWLAGIVMAILTWKRNPRPSLFAILAIAFMFVLDLVGIFMVMLPLRLTQQGYSMTRISMLVTFVSVALAILRAGGWVLLLAAIFNGRRALSAFSFQNATTEQKV